jgi:hypothetical protein
LLWITVERGRQGGRPALWLKLSPSPSTKTDGIRFAVEEQRTDARRLLTGPRELPRRGYRLTRQAARLRLCIEWWRQ